MPRMSGYEVCTHIKADDDTRRIPVVFISAKGQEAEVNTGYDLGAIDYILKPFAPDQLLEIIRNILTGQRLVNSVKF